MEQRVRVEKLADSPHQSPHLYFTSPSLRMFQPKDLLVLLVVVIVMYLLRGQGSYLLQPVWRHHQGPRSSVSPITADLDGDSINELIIISDEGMVTVLTLPRDFTLGDGGATILPQATTKSSLTLPLLEHDSVAIASLGKANEDDNILVVMTHGWSVFCLDRHLTMRWQTHLAQMYETLPSTGEVKMKAAAVTITSAGTRRHRSGMVIVGGLVKRGEKRREEGDGEEFLQDLPIDDSVHHFSTISLCPINGSVIWHHLPGDFLSEDEGVMRHHHKVHHWKLALLKGSLHTGEVPWERYATSLLRHLPHTWQRLADTYFTLDNIKQSDDEKREDKDFSWFGEDYMDYVRGSLGVRIPGGASRGGGHPTAPLMVNSIVQHTPFGLEVLDIGNGHPICRLPLPSDGGSYADVDGDGKVDQVTAYFLLEGRHRDCYAMARRAGHSSARELIFTSKLCSLSAIRFMFSDTNVQRSVRPRLFPPTLIPSLSSRHQHSPSILRTFHSSPHHTFRSVFTLTNGNLVSFLADGGVAWRMELVSSLELLEYLKDGRDVATPSVQYLASDPTPLLVISGWGHLFLVSSDDGTLLGSHSLPCSPTGRPTLSDFNNDDKPDIIISCDQLHVGFLFHQQSAASIGIIVASAIAFLMLLVSFCIQFSVEDEMAHVEFQRRSSDVEVYPPTSMSLQHQHSSSYSHEAESSNDDDDHHRQIASYDDDDSVSDGNMPRRIID